MQSVQKPSSSTAQLIQPVPNEVIISVFEFLDPKTTVVTARVCKAWRDNLELNNGLRKVAFDRIEESIELRQYPQEMVRLFRDRKITIFKLPVLNLGERMGSTGYIDILKTSDMLDPIMKFTDKFDRPGIAFHLEGHADGQVQIPGVENDDPMIPISSISGVLAVFKRYTNGDTWRVGMGGRLNYLMSKLHNERHDANGHVGHRIMECPNCPKGMSSGDNVNYTTLANLLDARDPIFRIAQREAPVAHSAPQAPSREEEKEPSKK